MRKEGSGRSPLRGSGCQASPSAASADAPASSQSGIPNAVTATDLRHLDILYEKTRGKAWEPPSPKYPWLVKMVEAGFLRPCTMRCGFEAFATGMEWTAAGQMVMGARVGRVSASPELRSEPQASRPSGRVPTGATHTLGPYSRSRRRKDDPKVFIYGSAPDGVNRPRIATVEFGMFCGNKIAEETEGNANLFASAPDLYEASDGALSALIGLHIATDEKSEAAERAIAALRSALTKARGES